MKKSKKKFLIWHFLIYIPLIIFLHWINIGEKLNPPKLVESTSYNEISIGVYKLFDIASGTEVGFLNIKEFYDSEMIIGFQGIKVKGEQRYLRESGRYEFSDVEFDRIKFSFNQTGTELFWFFKGEKYDCVLINLFSDDSLIPETIRFPNRKYYLIRVVNAMSINYIEEENQPFPIRESLMDSFYESKYAAIFYVDKENDEIKKK